MRSEIVRSRKMRATGVESHVIFFFSFDRTEKKSFKSTFLIYCYHLQIIRARCVSVFFLLLYQTPPPPFSSKSLRLPVRKTPRTNACRKWKYGMAKTIYNAEEEKKVVKNKKKMKLYTQCATALAGERLFDEQDAFGNRKKLCRSPRRRRRRWLGIYIYIYI